MNKLKCSGGRHISMTCHQIGNAAMAIAALRRIGAPWSKEKAIEWGLKNVEWPARLQRLHKGPLIDAAPKGAAWLP